MEGSLGARQQWRGLRGFFPTGGAGCWVTRRREDFLSIRRERLLRGCARASCCVADVGRQCLAQRSVSRTIGLGGVNGGLALRETARAKGQWSSGRDGKVVAVSAAREGHLSMKGTPDRGSLGSVTGTRRKPILVRRGISFEPNPRRRKPAGDRGVRGSIVSERCLGGQCPAPCRTIRRSGYGGVNHLILCSLEGVTFPGGQKPPRRGYS